MRRRPAVEQSGSWERSESHELSPWTRERQLDRKVNALFYDDRPLTPARYRRWLDANGVRYVAQHSLRAALRSHFRHLRAMGRMGVPIVPEMG